MTRPKKTAAENPFVTMRASHRAVLIGGLAAYFVAILILRRGDPTPTDDLVPLALAGYLALLAFPVAFARFGRGWFHPVVITVIFSMVALLRKLSMYAFGIDRHRALPLDSQELAEIITYALVLQCISLVSYYIGYFGAPRAGRFPLKFPRVTIPQARLILIAGIGAVGFLAYATVRGGVLAHVSDWSRGRHSALSGQHYQLAIASFGVPACLLWLSYHRRAVLNPIFWCTSGVSLMVLFLATGSRSLPLYAVAAGMIVWMLRRGRIMYLRVALAGLCALYLLTVLGDFRRSGWDGNPDLELGNRDFMGAVAEAATGELTTRSTTSDGLMPILARVPEQVPLLYGSSYLAVITLPVPRRLWPGKPGLVGGRVGRTFFGLDAGVPPGAIGEAYWNFHIVGVILIFMLFGAFHRWLAALYLSHREHAAAVVLYALTLIFWREPSSGGFVNWGLIAVPSLIVMFGLGALTLRSRQGSTPQSF